MTNYEPPIKLLRFPNGKTAQLIEVMPTVSASNVRDWMDIPEMRHAIVMHLGALTMEHGEQIQHLLQNSVVRFAEESHALVADGGTEAGVMQLMGRAYEAAGATFPLIGVTVKNSVTYAGGPEPSEGRWPLNPNHTHFVVVDADEFGVESHLLVGMASMTGNPGVALVVSGGEIVRQEIEMHAKIGTPVIVLKGTGRYADDLANAETTSQLRQVFDVGSALEFHDVNKQPPEDLYHLIRKLLLR